MKIHHNADGTKTVGEGYGTIFGPPPTNNLLVGHSAGIDLTDKSDYMEIGSKEHAVFELWINPELFPNQGGFVLNITAPWPNAWRRFWVWVCFGFTYKRIEQGRE